jgi:UPF0755 protein
LHPIIRKTQLKSTQKKILGWVLILGFVGVIAAYYVLFSGNAGGGNGDYFYVKSTDSYERMRENLIKNNVIGNVQTFDLVADKMNLHNTFKPGRYKISGDLSNLSLVRKIRNGRSEPVVLKLKSEISRDSLLTFLGDNFECSKAEIVDVLASEWATKNGFTSENIYVIFLPDHYFINWATPADKLVERFLTEYKKYWTAERIAKAKIQNLTPQEASILASVVDGEAIHVSEMATIAGLYLNRIEKGIPLQADPTILYVVGREGRRRVLYEDLKRPDPYNTYLNKGLPPGPIFSADKKAIEAVLSPKKHDYIFMCAKPDGSYKHNFTASMAEHNKNAAAYRRFMDSQGVRR